MDLLKKAVDKMTLIPTVQDGMGLEDRIQSNKGKNKELTAMCAPPSGCASDTEGSAIGNFVGLKRLQNENVRQFDQPTAGTSLHMMIAVQIAKSTKRQQMHKLRTGAVQVSALAL
ncbi:hypothetical protein CFC21_092334 [Triticum aestivum]|uniref:Uncharacterized protein n=2 Tax=Triticum aestivum TaxID=4565 RepID=A0A3B6QD67_WHEAT|nr:hypothetical protein CFC21_092334 [Triticum aestivum]